MNIGLSNTTTQVQETKRLVEANVTEAKVQGAKTLSAKFDQYRKTVLHALNPKTMLKAFTSALNSDPWGTISSIAVTIMLLTLITFGLQPTSAYIEANQNGAGYHATKYIEFGDRKNLTCRRDLTIGMVVVLFCT